MWGPADVYVGKGLGLVWFGGRGTGFSVLFLDGLDTYCWLVGSVSQCLLLLRDGLSRH